MKKLNILLVLGVLTAIANQSYADVNVPVIDPPLKAAPLKAGRLSDADRRPESIF